MAKIPTKTYQYDVSKQLRTSEEIAAHMDAWLTEVPEDSVGVTRALGAIAHAKGMAQVAADAYVNRES